MKNALVVILFVTVFLVATFAQADHDLAQPVLIAIPKADLDAAGIVCTNRPNEKGIVAVYGILHKMVPDSAPVTNNTPGVVVSSWVAMYAKYTSPTNGAVILWNDANKTSQLGWFTK